MSTLAIIEQTEAAPVKIQVTPMMQQYLAVKEAHKDCLLFYRMGDFYELFFEDAVIASEVLDIALTKRGKHESQDIPMCGVPQHSYEPYLQKLIRAGYKVAICEQMEAPEEAKKRGYKAVVRREVVRIVTPGTLIEENLLDAREPNFLVSLAVTNGQMAIAWIDISTGEFHTQLTTSELLGADLARLAPKEIVFPERMLEDTRSYQILQEYKTALTPHVASFFDSTRAENKIKSFYEISSLEGFGQFSRGEISACGALVEYVELTQKGTLPRLSPPRQCIPQDFMAMDAATRRNLEIYISMSGEKKGSLLSVIDRTITGSGARLLKSYLAAPLTNPAAIEARLDMVEYFIENQRKRTDVRAILKRIPDLERALARICIHKGGPRDLVSVRDGLSETLNIAGILIQKTNYPEPAGLGIYMHNLGSHDALISKLSAALLPEAGMYARDGGFIAPGYHARLDELRELRDYGKKKIDELRERYRTETSVSSLKITQNNVLGYFIEVTPQAATRIQHPDFQHRQTLANAVRYTTDALRTLESNIVNARDQALQLELTLFEELVTDIKQQADTIALCAQALAGIDVMAALAELAAEQHYQRPQLDNSLRFEIKGGRHPVVEVTLKKEKQETFIANDCNLSQTQRLWLMTGPNMAGKSTFLRQNALVVILAQMGSFVPADYAHIGTIDRVCSRVGASDDLARGRSTFMVEMVETASIVNMATERSLVILDEIGRGTATYDGLSIAWAVVEHIHNINRCRTLFATHYHELTALATKLKALACYTMKVKEWQGKVIFMHEVMPGAADRSYGIHVAKLAGLPHSITNRAEIVLGLLQQSEANSAISKLTEGLPLFANNNGQVKDNKVQEIITALSGINIDELSPKEALEILYKVKGML